jgi:WD40 repeat protein
VGGFAVSENGRLIATVGDAGTAAVWDARDGHRITDLPGIGSARAVLFTGSDRQLTVGQADGTLTTWDWADGSARNLQRTVSTDTEILALAVHGSRVFVAHGNHAVVVRDLATGREIRRWDTVTAPFSLALTSDARLLAVGTWIGTVHVWDVESGRKLDELKGPTALVAGLDFSPDGGLLAVSSRDGSTRVWDVATGQFLATIGLRRVGAERVRFFPDGRRAAIGYEDGEVEIRDLRYFFRHTAGQAEYQLQLFRKAGESFPRSEEVLAWSRRILAARPGRAN